MSRTPLAFLSYVNLNDQHDYGDLTQFRERLSGEVRFLTGEAFDIFQDRKDIAWGQQWQERLDTSLAAVTFLLPIITPAFFKSTACRAELERFLKREEELGRGDLILPVYYATCPVLKDKEKLKHDPLAQIIAARQYADWRELRHEPFTSPQLRKAITKIAEQIVAALERSEADAARAAAAQSAGKQPENDPQSAAGAASSSGWVQEPDEETNGTSGWTQTENKPFYFLAQPPDGEVFDKIEYKVGEYRLVGTVKRTRTDTLKFQNGQKTGQLTFYPDRVISKYWHEAAQPSHSVNGRTVTVNNDDPQFVGDFEYEFSALLFKYVPPATALAKGKSYEVAFDLHSKKG
ncbi:MAG: TIR domain-containing protein [Candidatus Electronema aureum]|uniref:TIR domain-containing protein n=1 Tax=Candidatus Electronema aureum TaxID=2005002 RepID=A0A521FZ87_9BACT|nr:MAG: TIR domain-containing protein [Candidatus Electronema aureum]